MKSRTTADVLYLSNDSVDELNQVHGWFQYEDAQSDVSRAFANNAINKFIEIAKEAEDVKGMTGMSPRQLMQHVEDLKSEIDSLERELNFSRMYFSHS